MSQRPRVLVDLLSYTGTKGGMETYTRELYRLFGQMDTGMEFVGLASKEGGRLDLSWFPGEVIRSRISGENRFVWAAGELVATGWVAGRRNADLLHSPATLGPMRTRMPAVLTIHDTLYWSHPELMSTPLYTGPVKWMETRAVRNAAHVITDSEASAVDIRKYLQCRPTASTSSRSRLLPCPLGWPSRRPPATSCCWPAANAGRTRTGRA